jgi:hypothetical protein
VVAAAAGAGVGGAGRGHRQRAAGGWYYKWLSPRHFTSRRPRPIEYARDNGLELDVLYDRPDELNPMYITCPDARPCARRPGFSPGTRATPRTLRTQHVLGAASTILAYFFGNDPTPPVLALERRPPPSATSCATWPTTSGWAGCGRGSTGAATTRPG